MYTRPIQLSQILAQPHPEIDLRLESYEKTTREFLDAVSNYTVQAVDEITRRRDQHALLLKKEAEKRKAMDQEIVDCKVKEIELMKCVFLSACSSHGLTGRITVLEQEQLERRESEARVTALKRDLNSVREKCASVDVEIDQLKGSISILRSGEHILHFGVWTSSYPQLRKAKGAEDTGGACRKDDASSEDIGGQPSLCSGRCPK